MKNLLFGLMVLMCGCSHPQNNVSLIKDNIERQLFRVDSAQRSLLIKSLKNNDEKTSLKINKLDYLKDSLNKELNKIKSQITNDWYKGRKLPCEKVLRGLDNQKLNLTDYEIMSTSTYDIILRINFGRYNMEYVNIMNKEISKDVSFEPKVTDKYGTLLWTTSYGRIEVYESGGGSLIFQYLSLEKK